MNSLEPATCVPLLQRAFRSVSAGMGQTLERGRRSASRAGQDRLFELIDGLSAPGSVLAAESASPSDPHASRRSRRIRETREAAAAVGDTFLRDVRSLWFDHRRSYLANWLGARGWQTTTSEAEDLMACYGRAPGLDALGVAPLSAFVQGSR